jgi:2-oxoisovalerate dehydrogenase E1 component
VNRDLLLEAITIRAFETTLLAEYSKGGIRGTIHTSLGQEFFPVLLSKALDSQDAVFGTHRSHAMYLALTKDFEGLMSEIFGVEGATSKGLGGSQHLHKGLFFSNGIQGGLVPVAVGASDLKFSREAISVSIVGDGTFGQGVLYESLNLAAIYSLPFILVVEDNKIAQSTPTKNVISSTFRAKATAFDVAVFECGSNLESEWSFEIDQCFNFVRSNSHPALLLVHENRLGAHSKGDDNRDPEEIQEFKRLDYLNQFMNDNLFAKKYFDEKLDLFSDMAKRVREKNKCRESFASLTLQKVVCVDRPLELTREQSDIRKLTYDALKNCMEVDSTCKILGQDIEYMPLGTKLPYGGAFSVTKDLSLLFPGRVQNTPISEASVVGFAIGRALVGASTIVEIMFGDFCTLVVDQVRQQASKLMSMYGEIIEMPVLLRTPMGGRRGYGPTHSQNYEMLFFGIPNVIVYVQNIFFSSSDYAFLLSLKYFCVVIEHKDLYNFKPVEHTLPFNVIEANNTNHTIILARAPSSILIVTYGYALNLVLEAVERIGNTQERFFNILALKVVSPLKLIDCRELFISSKHLVLVEECDARIGLTGMLNADLIDMDIKMPIYAIGGKGDVGASEYSENASLLTVDKIIKGLKSLN